VAPAVLILIVGMALASFAMPRAAAACSCAMATMDDARTQPEAVVLTGIVEPRDGRGYPVTVTRWFKGGGIIEPRAWLHPGGFSLTGGGADCSVPPLPVGAEYIFIAYTFEGMYSVGLCSPHAAVATAEGQAMLADAVRVFGPGGPPSTVPPPATDPPAAPTTQPVPGDQAPASIEMLALIAVVVLGLGALVGLVGARRRLRGDSS
jgi:hypothetical protein